jgi:hypothetical protein
LLLEQSPFTEQVLPAPQAVQTPPPQSVLVSPPFWTPSLQLGA